MKKIPVLIATIALLAPLFASAQTLNATSTATATPAQIMTQCAQSAIDVRDSAIGSARTAYNNTMAIALDARKDAEKKAVALEEGGKKDAIEKAVDAYKTAVSQAQDTLTQARKDAWSQFEANTAACRDMSNQMKRGTSTLMKAQANVKTEGVNAEGKSFKDTFGQFIKSLLKIGEK